MTFAGEREFAGFGADTGACRERPHVATPGSATIRRLQTALAGLAKRTKDPRVATGVDGVIGPKTVNAVNYALPKYVAAPAAFASGALTKAQVVGAAVQLAAYIDKGPNRIEGRVTTEFPAAASTQTMSPSPAQQPGGTPMPPAQYYPPQPGYAPAPYYPYAPQPQREASVDIKAFIPAQYEHVRFNPMTVALVIAVGVGTVLVMNKRKGG